MIDGLEVVADGDEASDAFARFVDVTGARLRVALVARYGVDIGVDACADALAYAWEHWDRVRAMANPGGYLFRVGQTSARRHHRANRPVQLPPESGRRDGPGDGDDGLDVLLAVLDERQRVAVVLAHVYEWTYAEIADVLDVPVGTVRNLIHRGLTKLRRTMEP